MATPPAAGKGPPPAGGKGTAKGLQLTFKEKQELERKNLEDALSAEANFSGQNLTAEEAHIINENGTEPAHSGEYNKFMPTRGYFACRKCGSPVYSHAAKFECTCGWAAFDKCIQGSIAHRPEDDGTDRIEATCSKCEGHLGHIFVEACAKNGRRTNQRHCVNSMSLKYVKHELGTEVAEEILAIQPSNKATVPFVTAEVEQLDLSNSNRFDVDDARMFDHLEEHGFAVIRNVATPEQLKEAEGLLWQFLSENAGWSRNEPSSWTDDGLMHVSSNGLANGIINKCGAGQSELNWFVRTLPRVRQVFEAIWGTSDLLTSFDVFGLFRPWHHGFSKTLGGWFHVDQGRTKTGRQSVQGLLSLYDQDATTGGLTVIPGSHLRHSELLTEATSDEDYIEPPKSHSLMQLPRRLICCQAGDLVLWDSRCLHCNSPAVQTPESPGSRLLRAVVYVCMTPKAWATSEVLERRRSGYEMRVTTTHWPHVNAMGVGWAKAPPLDFAAAPPARQALIC